VAVALDGFDLVVLGAVTPALLEYEPWGLTPPQVGAITSYGLVGMMSRLLGGLLLGTGLAVPWGFYAFALVGRLGAVFVALVPRSPAEGVRQAPAGPEAAAR
jgi:hypothetical protein